MDFIYAFLVGGAICVIGQVLLDFAKLTPAHLMATFVVIALAFVFPLSGTEVILLVLVTGLVWITEMINTAIEKTMDLISEERKPEIKFIKDLAAASVLVAVVVALVTGCIIFIPKL